MRKRTGAFLKQSLAVMMSFSLAFGPCAPGIRPVFGARTEAGIDVAGEETLGSDVAAEEEVSALEEAPERVISVQEEAATASDASTASDSDAELDEDGFLLDGVIKNDAMIQATLSNALALTEIEKPIVSPDAIVSGTCGKDGDNLIWEITGTEGDYTLRISGTGEMEDYLYHGPWFNSEYPIDHWILEEGMTSIGEHAFDQCAPENNGVVKLPESVKVIEDGAFMNSDMSDRGDQWCTRGCTCVN